MTTESSSVPYNLCYVTHAAKWTVSRGVQLGPFSLLLGHPPVSWAGQRMERLSCVETISGGGMGELALGEAKGR